MVKTMLYFLNIRWVATIIFICMMNSACGVKSSPQHPNDSSFPMAYPTLGKPSPVFQKDKNSEIVPSVTKEEPRGLYQYPNPPSYVPPKN